MRQGRFRPSEVGFMRAISDWEIAKFLSLGLESLADLVSHVPTCPEVKGPP